MQATIKNFAAGGRKLTPYERAAREWDNRIGTTVVQSANWRRATFGALGLVGLSIGGIIYLGVQPKAVPHVVEVDRAGGVVYHGPVGRSWSEFKPNAPSIRYHLRRFIEDTRSVSFDPAVVKQNWLDAYSLVASSAANSLSAYAQENDPFKRSRSERVAIDLVSLVPISTETWQADWKETVWDRSGNQMGQTLWRGTFRIVLEQPKDEEAIERNPIGLFIQDFNFSRLGG